MNAANLRKRAFRWWQCLSNEEQKQFALKHHRPYANSSVSQIEAIFVSEFGSTFDDEKIAFIITFDSGEKIIREIEGSLDEAKQYFRLNYFKVLPDGAISHVVNVQQIIGLVKFDY